MFTKQIVIALLLNQISASTTADETFTPDLASCRDFASKFDNTCGDQSTQLTFANVPTASVTCQGSNGYEGCGGTVSGDSCTWNRKLCVTCYDDSGTVKIHVQTNGQPNHCYFVARGQPADQEVDYTVNWMPPAAEIAEYQVTEQGALNDLICDIGISKSENIPAAAGFVNAGDSMTLETAWGVAISGVMIFNGIGGSGVDAYYPAVYISDKTIIMDPTAEVEGADYCLAHPSPTGQFHYHTASFCAYDSSFWQFGSDYQGDFRALMESEWLKVPYQSAFAISKDGRPIYTPYNNNGQKRENCDVDICNGFDDANGNYVYQSTFHHPYVMGCFGKGSSPEVYQQCTSQPRLCNTQYYDGATNLKALTWAFFASAALLFTLF